MRYEKTETIIENTTMQKMIDEKTNELIAYRITPNEGFKLHSETRDNEIFDPNTLESTGKIELGFVNYPSFVQVGYNYDFEINESQLYTIVDIGM